MEQSILKSIKKILGIGPDDTSFDLDIMIHINTAFSTLNDLGVGPQAGFAIDSDDEEWADFLEDDVDNKVQYHRVKTFVYLTTRLAFDPPQSGFLLDSVKSQLAEVTWRLSVKREETDWVAPEPLPDGEVTPPDVIVIDGGNPGSD